MRSSSPASPTPSPRRTLSSSISLPRTYSRKSWRQQPQSQPSSARPPFEVKRNILQTDDDGKNTQSGEDEHEASPEPCKRTKRSQGKSQNLPVKHAAAAVKTASRDAKVVEKKVQPARRSSRALAVLRSELKQPPAVISRELVLMLSYYEYCADRVLCRPNETKDPSSRAAQSNQDSRATTSHKAHVSLASKPRHRTNWSSQGCRFTHSCSRSTQNTPFHPIPNRCRPKRPLCHLFLSLEIFPGSS